MEQALNHAPMLVHMVALGTLHAVAQLARRDREQHCVRAAEQHLLTAEDCPSDHGSRNAGITSHAAGWLRLAHVCPVALSPDDFSPPLTGMPHSHLPPLWPDLTHPMQDERASLAQNLHHHGKTRCRTPCSAR